MVMIFAGTHKMFGNPTLWRYAQLQEIGCRMNTCVSIYIYIQYSAIYVEAFLVPQWGTSCQKLT